MRYKTRQFIFHRTYEMAALVEGCVSNISSFMEIDWDDSKVLKCLSEFSEISLLHFYIYAMISVEEKREIEENDDLYEEDEEMREDLAKSFNAYGIKYIPYSEYISKSIDETTEEFPFRRWFHFQEKNFEFLWEKMTDEVFHLLFANRAFLLEFNKMLAQYLKSGKVKIPGEFLNEKGLIKRQHYFPIWVKKAIYYRDQGRCVLCQRDLSGLLSTDQHIHYDHIVPLNLWGVNDPCNLQLLCEECNLRKSGISAETACRYHPWWDY